MEDSKIKWLAVLGLILGLQITLLGQATERYTLERCIELAMQQNQNVINASLQTQGSRAVLQQSRASFLPSVSGYANQGISTGKSINPYTNAFINQEVGTGQYGVNASLLLFNGFSTWNTASQNALATQAAEMDYAQAKIDVSIQVLNTYLQILNSEELVKQALSQMSATQAQLDRLQVLQANEAVNPSVLYDTRGQLANDKLSLIQARGAAVNARLAMSQLLNQAIPSTADFDRSGFDALVQLPVQALSASDLAAALPGVQAAALRSRSALKKRSAAWGALLPTLAVNGAIASNYSSAALSQQLIGVSDQATGSYVNASGSLLPVYAPQPYYLSQKIDFRSQVKNNFNSYIGLSFQVPLFNGLRSRTQLVQASVAYRQAEVQQKTTTVRYAALIEQLFNDYKNALERYEVAAMQAKDYEASFRIATSRFERGAGTSFEYATSKNNFDKASVALISLRYECLFKGKVLGLYGAGVR